ncbi:hypothetical protein CYY_008749 [Polysphondylium violaceum]|uniref:TLDc domain-containing protein n=1 Tax=Polysphondylium violaceum TaxID=133409 RepID=A0A8J4UWP5_9MYCE|nr:hypothetical protein CYY_008749 [Polysphondylium violaceum]
MNPNTKKRAEISQSIKGLKGLINGHIESLEQQVGELEIRRDALLNVAKVIDVSVIPDPITLNIGGFKHQTTKATLTKIPNSFFNLMLSGEIDIKPMTNKPNTYFIDRDGTHFNYILNYLRDEGDIQIPEDIRYCVRKEMEFYRINNHFKLDDTTTIIDQLNSLKLKLDETEQELVLTKEESKKELDNLKQELALTKEEGNMTTKSLKQEFHSFKELIFHIASETNKFSASAFHSACDGKGPTITVIETTDGCVFGGYNSQSWKIHGYFYGDNKCFIFTLVNKHGIPPTKYLPKENANCVGSNSDPVIGFHSGNNDIRIGETSSYQVFPSTYKDTTGKGNTTLTPSKNFTIKNLEIYKCH